MTDRTAVVLGSTGLIGNELVKHLVDHDAYQRIKLIGRRKPEIQDPKIEFIEVNMEQLDQDPQLFQGDDVFCCLGTTMKNAGSKEAFRKVDFDMVVNAAKSAQMHANQFLVISSIGANAQSGNFYLRVKGEMEKAVLATTTSAIHILRPSILFGDRKEKRFGEKVGIFFMKILGPLLFGSLQKYKGIHAETVAKAMIKYALQDKKGKYVYESKDIIALAKNKGGKAPLIPSI